MMKPSLCASCFIVSILFLSFNRTYLVGEGGGEGKGGGRGREGEGGRGRELLVGEYSSDKNKYDCSYIACACGVRVCL